MIDANERAERTAALLRARRAFGAATRTRKRLPAQIPPRAIEREYARALLDIVATVRREIQPLLDELPAMLETARAERQDAGEGRRVRTLLESALARLQVVLGTEQIEALAERFAERTQRHQKEQLARQVVAALGVDIFQADRGLAALLDGFVAENVALIKNVPVKIVADIEGVVTRGLTSGTLTREITAQIQETFGVSERRARVIARDQIGKLNGQLNQVRQQEIGVTAYLWRTVRDERVRSEHAPREGERFMWAEPPSDGHPGQPVMCRCFSEPDFDEILGLTSDKAPTFSDVPDRASGTERLIPGDKLDLDKFRVFDKPLEATSPERLENVRDLFRQGRQNEGRGVRVVVTRDGLYDVVDGRHRLLAAKEFPGQPLKITFVRGV